MKYYKNPLDGLIYSYLDDGSEEARIPEGYVQLTPEEVHAHLNPPAVADVPQEISKAQGLLTLVHFGQYQAMQDFLASIPDPAEKLKAEINVFQRNTWERQNPALLALADGLGLSSAQLDDMFRFGAEQ